MKFRTARLALLSTILVTAFAVAQSTLVSDVRAAINRGDFAAAEQLVAAARAQNSGSPEVLEGLSWLARGALAAGDTTKADHYARDTESRVVELLKARPLDADKHLPIALGASIETEAKVMVANGGRASAVRFLQQALDRYRTTSIRGRLQK